MSKEVIIVGGGIIGATTAYYLSRHPLFSSTTCKITLIEASAHGPAWGASGKAGGLVAKWAFPKYLAALSFSEHARLAKEHNGEERWGWRIVRCGNWEGRGDASPDTANNAAVHQDGPGTARQQKGLPDNLRWVKEQLTDHYSAFGAKGATAQVHPYLFTTSMLELAKEKGVSFITGTVTSIVSRHGRVTGITYIDRATPSSPKEIPASHVILAAGAWSPTLLPALPISARRAHSIVLRCPPTTPISADVLFAEISLPRPPEKTPQPVSIEIYARPGNEVYACGLADDTTLPDNVDDVQVDQAASETILQHVSSISDELREATVVKRQACFLPVTNGGVEGPIIGEAGSIARGLYLATGHTCWVSIC
jgi:glycine/D-amino acid oxidase-like deaminating enzyme